MLEHRAKDWGDKVRIIGISIDKDAEAVLNHVVKNKWTSVEHFHRAGSDCSEVYGVQGVPHVMLVDGEGKLAFVGHPAVRDLEKDIDTLLKGEKLTGEGTGASEESPEAESAGGYKDLDLKKIIEDYEKFPEIIKSVNNDSDVKEKLKDMKRTISVLVRQSKYSPKQGKFMTKYSNINVLVGSKEGIDLIKEKLTASVEKLGGVEQQWRT